MEASPGSQPSRAHSECGSSSWPSLSGSFTQPVCLEQLLGEEDSGGIGTEAAALVGLPV